MTFYPSAGAGGGWTTLYDVDFTSLGTQDLTSGGDGNKTIDGKTWRADNTGSAAIMDILNGTGLRIQLGSAGDYLNGTRTAPIIAMAVTEVGGDVTFSQMRFWVDFSVANLTAANEGARMGVEADTANVYGPSNNENHMLSIQHDGANVILIPISTNNGGSSTSVNPNNYASEDLFMMQLNSPQQALTGLGTAATDLLNPENLQMVGSTQIISNADWAFLRTDNTRFFACVVDTGATDVLLTLKRLVIEMKS
jgi:hypothetical protein